MSIWREDSDSVGIEGLFDPLCIERSAPISDEEAALAEDLCQAATPGPLVVDEQATGDGAVVATLPDGRCIVSLTAGVEHTESDGATEANAQLICKARYLLLRLLRDRQKWTEERDSLLERVATLEAALGGGEASPPKLPR